MFDFAKIAEDIKDAPSVEKPKNKILVVDGNYLMQKFFHARGHVFGSEINSEIQGLLKTLHLDKTLMLFDSGRSAYRTQILPTYKGNRPDKSEEMADCFKKTRSYFLGRQSPLLKVLRLKDTEADDLASFICKNFKGKADIYLYSIDHDWFQLLDEGIWQIRPDVKSGRNLVYSRKTASQMLGYDVKKWPLVAAFKGDPSDNVPSTGIKENTALRWLEKYSWSLPTVFMNEPKAKAKEADIWRNYRLTKLDGSPCVFDEKDLCDLSDFVLN
jgi:5'-3' exonuclease